MYDLPSSLIAITLFAVSSAEYPPVCASYSRSSRRCLTIFFSRFSMYASPHFGRRLFRRRLTGLKIFTGFSPTSDSNGMSSMNALWSPTPNPNGITQALLISSSLDTQRPSIGRFPWKKVAPGLAPVCSLIASLRSGPSLSASALPRLPSITCSLWSKNKMILSPAVRHCFISVMRCLRNRIRGHVRSFFLVMKYRRCCW